MIRIYANVISQAIKIEPKIVMKKKKKKLMVATRKANMYFNRTRSVPARCLFHSLYLLSLHGLNHIEGVTSIHSFS